MANIPNSKDDYVYEIRRIMMDRHDLGEDTADNILDYFEDDIEAHFQFGDRPSYVADFLVRRYDEV